MTSLYWKSPSALKYIFCSELGCTSLLYDSEIHSLISQRELEYTTGVATLKNKNKVILNQKLYKVYLFKYNSYFYHDMQVDSFDEVKGVNQIDNM